MLIDTHMHIGFDFGVDPDTYIRNAKDAGVFILIASFCEKEDLSFSTEFVNKYQNLYASIGYHPEVSNKIVDKDYEILENMLLGNSKFVAIGEIGLDYYWQKDNKEIQRTVFRKQMALAEKLGLPVVIHSRDAINETYEILQEFPKVKGIMHCFSGSLEMAKKFIDLGYLLGVGGVITFKNSKLGEVIKNISLSNIVLETDSPYLAPEPVRGTVNESKNIPYIASKIATLKQCSMEEVEKITTKNALQTFDIKK